MFQSSKKAVSRTAAVLQAALIYISIALPLFWFVHLERGILQAAFIAGVLIADLIVVVLLKKYRLTKIVCLIAGIGWICIAVVIGGFLICRATLGDYRSAPLEADFFKEKHALFLVPHQDDDVALACGVAEQYIHSGSRVSLVFTTNGDGDGLQEIRVREALAAAQRMGIPQEDVHFLGFGNDWRSMPFGDTSVVHIYNSPEKDAVWTSRNGFQQTQSTGAASCYLDLPYTRENYVNSIKSILLELRPDVIYANDYDSHGDHRAVSLFFEEAMGEALRQDSSYHPTVFKGFCYRTAWYASFDFADSLNLLSTLKPPQRETELDINQYVWQDRVRMPLLTTGLNRLLTKTTVYDLLRIYRSQGAVSQTGAIANGDRVYWQRSTSSLLYDSTFQIGGEPVTLLNDFKLMDASDIYAKTADDGIQSIHTPLTITLPEPISLRMLGLYDDPRPENQILAGYLELDNGSKIEFGSLNDNGSVTYIPMPTDTFRSLTLHVTAAKGAPGLTEVEAYAEDMTAPAPNPEYFMFADEEDNFIYDYMMSEGQDSVTLDLYTYPQNVETSPADFQITQTGSDACSYVFQDDGKLKVTCPSGQSCEITVSYQDITCSMAFSNPGKATIRFMKALQSFDFDLLHSSDPVSINGQISHYTTFFNKMKHLVSSLL